MDPPPTNPTSTPPSPSPSPSPSLSKKKDEFQPSCNEEELNQNQVPRESVHYANITEFLASLKNVQDKAFGLEDYLRAVRGPRDAEPAKDRGN